MPVRAQINPPLCLIVFRGRNVLQENRQLEVDGPLDRFAQFTEVGAILAGSTEGLYFWSKGESLMAKDDLNECLH